MLGRTEEGHNTFLRPRKVMLESDDALKEMLLIVVLVAIILSNTDLSLLLPWISSNEAMILKGVV
jgi:hypothetical protein